ncbi:MAG: mandelate racemase/muconate lactonizing enzyme family protein [Chloroflexota bacterium]|nr:mandelate racemase/muconate lactonizing enzyme family protein [Chloroflexota bacterium]
MADGWTAAKFMPVPAEPDAEGRPRMDAADSIRKGVAIVAAARDCVGPEFELFIETHGRLRPVEAIELACRLEPYDPMFIEEPTRPEAMASFKLLREKIRLPIATGERLYSRWAFQPLIEAELVDYLQPDIVRSHGITEVRKIADYADTHLIKMAPHNPQSPVNTMAILHLDLVMPNFASQEVIWPFPRFFRELFDGVPEIKGGHAAPPSAPGLGITLKEDRAREIEYEPSAIDELMLLDGTYTDF